MLAQGEFCRDYLLERLLRQVQVATWLLYCGLPSCFVLLPSCLEDCCAVMCRARSRYMLAFACNFRQLLSMPEGDKTNDLLLILHWMAMLKPATLWRTPAVCKCKICHFWLISHKQRMLLISRRPSIAVLSQRMLIQQCFWHPKRTPISTFVAHMASDGEHCYKYVTFC